MPAGGTSSYSDVFMLKPGQSAEVMLPEDVLEYWVVECAVNPDIYNHVYANGTELTGRKTGNLVSGTARRDYETKRDSAANRTEVDMENHISDGAMRTLLLTKKLYDVDGTDLLHYPDNSTLFTFRLSLGGENADALLPANMYDYCVKNPGGFYCRWDAASQAFVSLGKKDYACLTEDEKQSATFTTSMKGSITKIPADYTIEVRNLILGTQYMVEERSREIPRGYTLRSGDGYTRIDVNPDETTHDSPYSGSILKNEDPHIEVRNQKGWGMTIEKVWTDRDFIASHDDVFFAVYLHTHSGDDVLYEDRVYRYSPADTDLYIFFLDLKYHDETYTFDDFFIREVTLSGDYQVGEDRKVTGFSSITPVADGESIRIGATPVGKDHQDLGYSIFYEKGTPTGHNHNIRTDAVTNSRPGIEIYKTDMNGTPLSWASFTLTDEEGQALGASAYVSRSDSYVTTAYLTPGMYFLTEIHTPKGYVVLDEPLTIRVDNDNQVALSDKSGLCSISPDPEGEMLAIITVRNRGTGLQVRKVDAVTQLPLSGVHFALYHQVTALDGTVRKDYLPISGYSDLVTDTNGILQQLTMDLPAGTYYLTETATLPDYDVLPEDFCLTIGTDGTLSIANHTDWLRRDTAGGTVFYTLTIPNGSVPEPASVTVSGKKILTGRDMEAGEFTFTMTPLDKDGAKAGPSMATTNAAGEAGEETAFRFAPSSSITRVTRRPNTMSAGQCPLLLSCRRRSPGWRHEGQCHLQHGEIPRCRHPETGKP